MNVPDLFFGTCINVYTLPLNREDIYLLVFISIFKPGEKITETSFLYFLLCLEQESMKLQE